jgi:hypothetical protein
VVDQGFNKAKTGNYQFLLCVKVLGTPDADNPENYIEAAQQYERTIYRPITEKSVEYVKDDLDKLGFTGTSFSQLDPSNPKAQLFTGQIIDCYCKHGKTLDNEPKEDWGLARKGGGGNGLKIEKPLEGKDFRELDMLFGKALKVAKPAPKSGPRPVAVGDGPAPIIDDDDIAF